MFFLVKSYLTCRHYLLIASKKNPAVLHLSIKSKITKLKKKIKFKASDKNVGLMILVYSKLTTNTPRKHHLILVPLLKPLLFHRTKKNSLK